MFKTLGIGDNVCDKYLHIATIYPGGNALNVAVFSKMFGADSAYLGTFGDDIVGKHVYDTAKEIGVDLSHCRFEHGENGCARVQLVNGDRVFLTGNHGGVSCEKPPILTDLDFDYIRTFDLIHTSVYSYMESQLPGIHNAAKFVSMDFSNRNDEEYFKQCCPFVDCVEISCGDQSEKDIKILMQQIFSWGCRNMVIATRGSKGACVMADGIIYEQSPCLVHAKDTMGAGDSFIACFLTNYLEGIQDMTEFSPESGYKGITTGRGYKECLIRTSLFRAAVFSSIQCQREGSFGYGKKVSLTEEDKKVMRKESI